MPHMLRSIIIFCLVFSCIAPLCSQSTESVISESEMLIPDATTDEGASNATLQQPSGIMLFLRMILVLALVIAAIYGVIYLLKKISKTPDADSPYIKYISGITVAPGKTVHIVTVGNRGFILGASESSLSLISELDDRELIDSMNLQESVQNPVPKRFTDFLSSFMPFKRSADSFTSSNTTESTAPVEPETRLHSLTDRFSKKHTDIPPGDL